MGRSAAVNSIDIGQVTVTVTAGSTFKLMDYRCEYEPPISTP